MKLKPFFRWVGSKASLRHLYPPPKHDIIIEPFAGSAGYSLAYPEKQVILIDQNRLITSVWKYLISASEQEILSLPNIYPEQALSELDVPCEEARMLIRLWVGLYAKNAWNPEKVHLSRCWGYANLRLGRETVWGPGAKRRIVRQLKYIRHWQVFHGDYAIAPDIEATWFIDPPYQRMCKEYPTWDDDYARLRTWVLSRRGQVIVCEGAGADWLPFRPLAERKRGYGKVRRKKDLIYNEMIWTNDE